MASQAEARMRKLEAEIRRHQNLYYVQHKPLISDRQFDRLLEELSSLEKENPGLASPDSPTRLVGSDLDNSFPKFKHTIPVLSLANTYSTEEAVAWAEKTCEKKETILIEWKVDGATLVLYYEKGKLERAVTRGTGQVGDVVTENARTIRSIPDRLSEEIDLTVRGEAYMNFDEFDAFNEQQGNIYANPRNLVSGSLKHKKSRETALRPIRWVAFEAYFAKDEKLKTDSSQLDRLSQLGLPVFESHTVSSSGLAAKIELLSKKVKKLNFPVDGLVLKVDDLNLRRDLGYTSASPRWATALKFEPELAQTTVEEIEVFTGRTGRVTPRARLVPVKLAGTTVTYATLHNADYIEKLGVRVGSTVKISKRGEIIPAVEEVVDQGKGPPFSFPKKCPSCGSKLVRGEEAADWLCPNEECDEKLMNAIVFFCQRKQMDIAGLGERNVEILFRKGFVKTIPDLYRLGERKEELEAMEGFGSKSVQIILEGIEASKKQEYRRVLYSLGLREIGPSVTDILLDHGLHSIDDLINAARAKGAVEALQEIHGIGPSTAEAIVEQLNDKRVLAMIDSLRQAGLQFSQKIEKSNLQQIFEGQTWCVTGSFENFKPRDLAMAEVKKRGGKVVSGVSKKTSHLLAGEGAGSKLEQAEKFGTTIVSEEEFLRLIG
ncbi:MAG TPA: NAD-dependent DNA ligase LigA [Leptospiraceae bacterium]|nr:NAD-dependent DNA ligase LigA [Leptospiraceae bacterium]HMY46090.1 NAD-dependent DNA ligase LigA [Leptospiraceae bacterium]HNN58838.1 NAD-dependent DNA ligase LigA [Leptospiraceae bacterium]